MGRPSKYKPEFAEQAYKLSILGATDIQLSKFFKVNERSIHQWKDDYPEFSQSLKRAKDEADNRVKESLYNRALGYTHKETKVFCVKNKDGENEIITHDIDKIYPPDPTSMIFWLKNRQKAEWRDRVEHVGKDGADLTANEMTDLELARKVAFILTNATQPTHH